MFSRRRERPDRDALFRDGDVVAARQWLRRFEAPALRSLYSWHADGATLALVSDDQVEQRLAWEICRGNLVVRPSAQGRPQPAGDARPSPGKPAQPSVPVLRTGSRGEDVRKLQALLNERLTPPPGLAVDGVFGASTREAVLQYQRGVAVAADGVVGKATWFRLLSGTAVKAPPVPAQGVKPLPGAAGPGAKPAPEAGATKPAPQAVPAPPLGNQFRVYTWPLSDKFADVLKRTTKKLPGEVQEEWEGLISPENLAIMAGTLVVWAGSHAFGVGQFVDIALLVTGGIFLGKAILDVAGDIGEFLVGTATAADEQDLDRAASHLGNAVAVLGVAAFVALLTKVGARGIKKVANRKATLGKQTSAPEAGDQGAARAGSSGGGGGKGQSSAQEAAPAAAEKTAETAKPVGSKCEVAGCPISMVSGEEMLEVVDFTWDVPLPLTWRRFYRSGQSDRDRQLGHGWLTPLDEWLEVGERVAFCNADGQRIDLPLPKVGSYSINVPERLRLYRDPRQFRLADETGVERVFSGVSGHVPLVRWHDRFGQHLDFLRDPTGSINLVSSSSGKHLFIERNGGRITAIHPGKRTAKGPAPAGDAWVRYEYSDSGDLIAVKDRLGHGERYAYRNHVIARRTLASGFSFQFEWDSETPQGKCLRNWGDNGIYDYRFEWLPDGVSKAIDSRGGVTVYEHDHRGLLLRKVTPEGRETRNSYDANHQLRQTTGPGGGATRYDYDDEGRLVSITDPIGHRHVIDYDRHGNPTRLTDPQGGQWVRRYDVRGRLQEALAPNGALTRYAYNAHGLLGSVTNAAGQVRTLLWDGTMRLVGETGYDGSKTRYEYDVDDRIVAVVRMDKRTTRYEYDAAGRIVAVQGPDGSTVRLGYDAAGQLTRYTDALGHSTEYRYEDGLAQPTARVNADGTVLRYQYDGERSLVGLVNPKGETYRLVYDRDENLVEEIGFDGRVQRYEYDAGGFLSAYRQPGEGDAWRETRFERDRVGRLLRKHGWDGSLTQFGYDPLGRLQLARNADGTLMLGYNALGQISQENQNGATVRHGYDLLGRRIATETPDGRRIEFRYGSRGELERIDLDGSPLSRHRYDEFGQEISRTQGKLESAFEYDPMGRLLRHHARSGKEATPVLGRDYRYDAAGKLTTIDDFRQGQTRYVYDPAERLVQVEGLTPERFVHDPADNLIGQDGGAPGLVKGDRLLMMGDRHFTYDAAGNLAEERRGKEGRIVTRYAYDSDNRLVRAETPNGVSTYRYDALGRRVAKSTESGESRFLWDGPVLLAEIRDGSQSTYVFEPGTFRPLVRLDRAASSAEDSTYYFHLDHLGTPREMTDVQGRIVWSARYRAYGALALADKGAANNPLRFQGQYFDAETGLHYNFSRYYDPDSGRFISQDPIGLSGGDNPYWYAHNPVNWIDPLGQSCKQAGPAKTPGTPIWSATKKKSAVENAFGHWDKHKGEFPELANSKQYVEAAHSLAASPPATALIKQRGVDTLIYDQATNTFLVKGPNGAPRTMFRPTDGINYWNQQ